MSALPFFVCVCALSLTYAQPPAPTGSIPAPPDVAAPPADAQKSPSGLASKVLKPGTGPLKPKATDLVTVHYTGWTTDGKMFDSSRRLGKSITFPLDRVIKGWSEGVQLMTVGEQRRLWIPAELAYAGNPRGPQGMLVFDIELISILQQPTTPADVATPPADAVKTKSGLASKLLKAGTGSVHPKKDSTVVVHYTGWTTDGKMFDSSVMSGEAAQFRLDQVIEGWTEGVQLMTEGESRRFWIPEKLAYKGERDPRGMLVFDVTLIAIAK